MKRKLAVSMYIASIIFAVLMYCAGCSREAKEAMADSSYAAEQLRCVDKYDTREQIDECRKLVRERWGVAETVHDGGAK